MGANDFVLEGNRLVVHVTLDAGMENDLQKQCERLLQQPQARLVVDLAAVDYVHSLSIGVLSYAWVEALNRDKELSFVASQYVADVFERTGLNRVFTYKLAGKDGNVG